MKTIIVATQNKGKVKEIKEMLGALPVEVKTMAEAGIDIDVDETGTTFEENALLKAEAISQLVDGLVIADDSGLEIDYFDKAPGVYSARYLGKDTPYAKKNQIILERLENVPKEKRTARFVCAMALCEQGETKFVGRGTLEGYIGHQAEGENGFGYDPIFYIEELGTSTANISMEDKNQISHRAKALQQVIEVIRREVSK